jgi:hypothetical protein
MRSRRYPEARRAVHQAYAAAEGDAERGTARKGFVAMYWLQRLDDADPVAAPAISAQARRALGTTVWRELF